MFDVVDPLQRLGKAGARERASEWLASYEGAITWKTMGFRKLNGRWMIVHDHGSIPFNATTGKASLSLKPE